MLGCRKVRGMIAASVYGDITDQERLTLEGHFSACPACRIQAEAMATMTARILVSHPTLDRDLLPALRARLAEKASPLPRWNWNWRYASVAAACALLAVVCVYGISGFGPKPHENQLAAVQDPVSSPVQDALDRASALAQSRDFANAYRLLKETVETHSEDSQAGEVQRRRADLAFASLHWYPEAYEDYARLAQRYAPVFRTAPNCRERFDTLAEARGFDYAPLYALDAARRNTDDPFAQLEKVVARYPNTFVAALAVDDMTRVAATDAPVTPDANRRVASVECARDRCTDPIAVARLNLELGHLYQKDLNDPERARALFTEVAGSGNTVLAELAMDSLARLAGIGN